LAVLADDDGPVDAKVCVDQVRLQPGGEDGAADLYDWC
jgi:hypothetical protein